MGGRGGRWAEGAREAQVTYVRGISLDAMQKIPSLNSDPRVVPFVSLCPVMQLCGGDRKGRGFSREPGLESRWEGQEGRWAGLGGSVGGLEEQWEIGRAHV